MIDSDFPYLDENKRITFPEIEENDFDNGIIAVGANLSPGVLLSAYSQGLFPWNSSKENLISWWNPDPRCVLFPEKLYVSKRMERRLKSGKFTIKYDTCFKEVMTNCAKIKRKGQNGTWIFKELIEGYTNLHKLGWAHSVESFITAIEGKEILVGGLYGVSLGKCFFGESMFSKESDASKAAFITMVRQLKIVGIELIDCQIENPHLLRFGAENIPRKEYMKLLAKLVKFPDSRGQWENF